MLQRLVDIVDIGERVGGGEEANLGALAAFRVADHLQMFDCLATFKPRAMFLAIAPDRQLEPGGERVDDRNADAVEAARDLVGIGVELTACMELGHDDLGGRDALFRVNIDRNAAPVVAD